MTKRPLVCAAIFFAAGILTALFKINISVLAVLGVVLAVIMIFRRKQALFCFLLFLCCLLGVWRGNSALNKQSSVTNHHFGAQKHLVMTVTDFSDDGKVIAEFKDGKDKIRIYLNVKSGPSFAPGQIIDGDVFIYAPTRSKTVHNDFSAYLCSRGVYLYGKADSVEFHGTYEKGFMGSIYACRRYMNSVGEKAFSGDIRALFNAMVLGDKSLLSGKLSASLQGAGLNHIAVVSGMHLSVLIAAVGILTSSLFGKLRRGYVISLLFAFLLMLITGAGASVVRAFIMCALYQAAHILYRERDPYTSLGFAAFVMLFVNPFLVHNAGFVLSVLSVLGILLFCERFFLSMERIIPEKAAISVALTLSATIGVMAAVVYYFGIITPYAVLSNLLTFIPTTFFVVLGMLFVALWKIPFLGTAMAFIIKLLARIIINICSFVSDIPGAIISVEKYTVTFLVVWLLILMMLLMKPLSMRKKLCATVVFVVMLVTAFSVAHNKQMRVFSAVYGQNTLTKVTLKGGEEILIDCPDSYDVRYMEESSGNPFLWGVITTKNYEEMLQLARGGNLLAVVMPEAIFTEEERDKILEEWKTVRARVILLPDGKRVTLCGAQIEFLPTEKGGRGVKLIYGKKTLISLQGTDSRYVEKLVKGGEKLLCDHLVLPFTVLSEGTDVSALQKK